MLIDDIPLWLVFTLTTLLIVAAVEGGILLGKRVRRKTADEKESPVGAIVGTVLALLAFILAFTFGFVADKYDARKDLVREQASAIRTSYLRADFLPQPERDEAKALYVDYARLVLQAGDIDNFALLPERLTELQEIQRELWNIAVENVRAGDNSDISAMYVESINEMSNVTANRYAVAAQSRLPSGVWIALYALVLLSMVAVGYQIAISESRRTWMTLPLALSFAIVIVMIAALDDPERGYLPVSQRPLTELQEWMGSGVSP